jgi:AsmA-like C-terminal region
LKRALKIGLRILAVLLALVLLAFVGGWIYLKQHKKEVISFIESEASKGLNGGELQIHDISIGFKHTFPRVAFTIDTLVLRDSLWNRHHHDLISTTRAYATLDFFKLVIGKISVGRVQLENPKFYIYTDSTGYTNTSVFKKNNPQKKNAPKNLDYPILEIRNGAFTVDKRDKNKYFGFDIPSLECRIHGNSTDGNLVIDASLNARIRKMTFNAQKGPYLEGKTVVGEIQVRFNKDSKILQFEKIKLAVDKQPFIFTGKFFLAEIPTPFLLSWETDNLSFRQAASFLSVNIRKKLEPFDISETITHLTGSLDNSEPEYKTPLIKLKLKVENRAISTPVITISKSTFIATFNNEEIRGKGHEDSNTVMRFTAFRGSYEQLDFHCDSIEIRDLIHPRMKMHLTSQFKLENFNNFMDENALYFTKGTGKLDLRYSGSLEKTFDSLRMISGTFNLDSAGLLSVPRNLQFSNGTGLIRFQDKDILVEHLSLNSGSTDLTMDGKINSIFYLINQEANKLSIDWTVRSNKINLNDFTGYLQPKHSHVPSKKKKSSFDQTLTQFTSLLETADFNLDLHASELIYKKFSGTNLQAGIALNENEIELKKIELQHGGGSVSLSGSVRNEPSSNPFSFKTELKKIDVSKIFYAFNNFGLKSPTDKNIRGSLSAYITLHGRFTNKAVLIQDDLKGFVKFNLLNGQLVDFEPVQKIQETVFKKRDFSDIRFAELHDLLEINGQTIHINRMEIRSTVLHMFVEGSYNFKTGPDLSIQVPLSNLKTPNDSIPQNKGINSKTGVSARLRAQKGEDGKIKISWDPFNKSGKKRKADSEKSKT